MTEPKPTKLFHVPPQASKRYKSRKTCCVIIGRAIAPDGRPMTHLAVAYATHDDNGLIDPPLSSGKAVVDLVDGIVKHRDGKFWTYTDELEPYTLFKKEK